MGEDGKVVRVGVLREVEVGFLEKGQKIKVVFNLGGALRALALGLEGIMLVSSYLSAINLSSQFLDSPSHTACPTGPTRPVAHSHPKTVPIALNALGD